MTPNARTIQLWRRCLRCCRWDSRFCALNVFQVQYLVPGTQYQGKCLLYITSLA